MTLSEHERQVLAEIESELSRSRTPIVRWRTRALAFIVRYWAVGVQLAVLIAVIACLAVVTTAPVAVPAAIVGAMGGYLLCRVQPEFHRRR